MKIKGLRIYSIEIKYFLFTLIVVFSDILGNGNLNLLYFAGITFAALMINKQYFWKDIGLFFVPFLFIPTVFFLFHNVEMEPVRVFVYSMKMFANISLFSYFKHNFCKVDLHREINRISIFFSIIFLASIVFFNIETIPLWRYHDEFNTVSKTRLQFFYSEPSVLGFLTCILLIFAINFFLDHEIYAKNIRVIGILGLILVLTFSISAIAYLAVAVGFMILYRCMNRSRIKKRILMYIPPIMFVVLVVVLTNNPIHNRMVAILSGQDASFFFRATLASSGLKGILYETGFWGMGLSNMNTEKGLILLSSYDIPTKFANSFMYFIAENGFLGIIYIGWLVIVGLYSLYKRRKDDNTLRIALLIIWFISQISGGYFTDPTLWMLFGVICSSCDIGKQYEIKKGSYESLFSKQCKVGS